MTPKTDPVEPKTPVDQGQGKSIEERIEEQTAPKEPETKAPTTEAVPTSKKESTPEPKGEAPVEEPKVEKPEEPKTESVATPAPEEDDLKLPDGVSERTKEQFDKLKAQLADAKAKAKSPPQPPRPETSVFDTFRAPDQPAVPNVPVAPALPFLNQQQVTAIQQQFVDDEGNVDVMGLNQALLDANKRAQDALSLAQQSEDRITRFEENQQVREAHTVHPELDPQASNFDPTLFDMVRDRLLRNMYEGKKQTLLEVTNELKKVYKQEVNVEKVKDEAVESYKESQKNRDQEPIESGKGAPREEVGNLQELREQTRQGKAEALDKRLKDLGVL